MINAQSSGGLSARVCVCMYRVPFMSKGIVAARLLLSSVPGNKMCWFTKGELFPLQKLSATAIGGWPKQTGLRWVCPVSLSRQTHWGTWLCCAVTRRGQERRTGSVHSVVGDAKSQDLTLHASGSFLPHENGMSEQWASPIPAWIRAVSFLSFHLDFCPIGTLLPLPARLYSIGLCRASVTYRRSSLLPS